MKGIERHALSLFAGLGRLLYDGGNPHIRYESGRFVLIIHLLQKGTNVWTDVHPTAAKNFYT